MAIPSPAPFNMQPEGYRYLLEQQRAADSTAASLAALSARQEAYDVTIAYPTDGDYPIEINAPYAYTITQVDSQCTAGSCTATVKIGSTALGGTANAVSTSLQSQTHSTANAVALTNATKVTISANSACVNLRLVLWITRT